MKTGVKDVKLTALDEIFSENDERENVIELDISTLVSFKNHHFKVEDNSDMELLVDSVKQYGVLVPVVVREIDGSYELVSGHRRKRAAEIAGITTIPAIVRELDDDEAVIIMVDSNLFHRERILPSEKAFAYKMKLDALNHSGVKGDKHSCEIVADQTGESATQLFRFIRLTELIEVLLDKADAKELALTTAVELSFLNYEEQRVVADRMAKYDCRLSLSQAVRLKKLKQAGTLTEEVIDTMLAKDKKPNQDEPRGSLRFRRFFPLEYSAKQIELVIYELLRDWQKQNNTT